MTSDFDKRLGFQSATLLLYRLFDVADEIDLDRAEALLLGAATRLKLSRERSEYLEILQLPLTVQLGQRELRGESGQTYTVDAYARLFSFGALSVRYDLALPPEADSSLAASLVHNFEGSKETESAARAEAIKLCERLVPALDTPHTWEGSEVYAVLFARACRLHDRRRVPKPLVFKRRIGSQCSTRTVSILSPLRSAAAPPCPEAGTPLSFSTTSMPSTT